MKRRVFIINKTGEGITQQERVQAFDADTGKLAWQHVFNVWHSGIVEDRLGFTHMVGDPETGYVYAHGTQGLFFCFDGKSGKVIWKRSLTEQFGRVTGYGGRVTSPIVDEDKVIVSMPNASWGELTVGTIRFVAFDKKTGKIIWWGSGGHRVYDTYYSTPVVAVINGQRLLISGGGDGCVHALQVRTGKKVWSYQFGHGAVNASPVVQGNLVWIAHGEENDNNTQGRIICLDAGNVSKGEPKLLWQVDGIKVKFTAPILHEGRLYVCDDAANLYCLDARSSKQLWQFNYGKNTKGDPVWADGKIYVSEVDSKFHILKPSDDGCTRLFSLPFRSRTVAPVELHGASAVANGRVYFTTTQALICIGKKDHKSGTGTAPPLAEPPPKGGKPAWLQIVPADVTLAPGQSEEFRAYAYDEKGQRLGEVEVEWGRAAIRPPVYPIGLKAPNPVKAPAPPVLAGKLSATSGKAVKLTVASAPNGQFGGVTAKMGGLTAYARVRVAPVLPYTMDFARVPVGRTPAGWVNTAGKFAVVEKDGRHVLRKRNDNASPLVARANAYISSPDLTDYTVESDVMGTKVRDKDMPDIGISACRYTLLLVGNDQELRLNTWDAQKRIEKKIDFPWKPNVWYRMKIMATVVNGKGVVKGKIWPTSEKEPQKWALQIEDPVPNRNGAPVIYGFANGTINAQDPGAEIFYANVKVTPNKK
jgi:outer membrane protein assembly factor BamB